VPPGNVDATGLVHAANAPPSLEHSNVAATSGDVNENDTLGPVVEPSEGPAVIVVSGVVVSSVHASVAGVGSTLPAGSTARA